MVEIKSVKTADGKKLQDALDKLRNCSAKIGWFENNRYPDEKRTPVAEVAYLQENGGIAHQVRNRKNKQGPDRSHVIPPRPFIRPAIRDNEKRWLELISKGSKKVLNDEMSIETLMGRLALDVEGQIKQKITERFSPELSEMTLAIRKWKREKGIIPGGFTDKPLQDSNHMFLTVNHKIENE